MSKPKGLEQLQNEWYSRLRDSGFVDIENEKEYLKQYDRRTIAFENREIISEFFNRLDAFLNDTPSLPILHAQILTQYSEGKYIKDIAKTVSRSTWTVGQVILKYKKLLT